MCPQKKNINEISVIEFCTRSISCQRPVDKSAKVITRPPHMHLAIPRPVWSSNPWTCISIFKISVSAWKVYFAETAFRRKLKSKVLVRKESHTRLHEGVHVLLQPRRVIRRHPVLHVARGRQTHAHESRNRSTNLQRFQSAVEILVHNATTLHTCTRRSSLALRLKQAWEQSANVDGVDASDCHGAHEHRIGVGGNRLQLMRSSEDVRATVLSRVKTVENGAHSSALFWIAMNCHGHRSRCRSEPFAVLIRTPMCLPMPNSRPK